MQTKTTAGNRPASFEDACKITGDNPTAPQFTTGTPQSIAFNRLSTIAAAIRQAPPPSFDDVDTRKHYGWHYYQAGVGFRFWFAALDGASAGAPGGAALCFNNAEDAYYFYNTFIHEFVPFYTNKKQ